MKMRNSNGPSTGPCGTPLNTIRHPDPLLPIFKPSLNPGHNLPSKTVCPHFSYQSTVWNHIKSLGKIQKNCVKTATTINDFSNQIQKCKQVCWLRKLCCESRIRSCLSRCLTISSRRSASRTFDRLLVKLTGLQFSARFLEPFLQIGATFAFLQSSGTLPSQRDRLKMVVSGSAISVLMCFNSLGDKSSAPADLSSRNADRRFCTSSSLISVVVHLS